jgi:hypothetical protein
MMRGRLLALLALGLLFAPRVAQAGIYLTDEPPPPALPPDFPTVKKWLVEARSVPLEKVEQDSLWRAHYRNLAARLENKQKQGGLLLPDRIDLGACYLRMNRHRDAKRVLEDAERLSTDDWNQRFLLFANLATTYHGLAESEQQPLYFDQAVAYQKKALALWPQIYSAWPQAWMGLNYRRSEVFYLRLLELRRDEHRRRPGVRTFEQVDDLFAGVRFLGPDGEYEAGRISWDSWDKLPVDAAQILFQLMMWLPFDDRLFWLFGEVRNAHNQVIDAYAVVDDLVTKRKIAGVRELNRHRQVLAEAASIQLAIMAEFKKNPNTTLYLMAALTPRALDLPPGPAGAAAPLAIWPALEVWFRAQEQQQQGNVGPGEPPPPRGPREWQAIFVGFLAGIVVGILGVWQVRQWRQRNADSLTQRRLTEG